jgi:signal transduction histidine kinase
MGKEFSLSKLLSQLLNLLQSSLDEKEIFNQTLKVITESFGYQSGAMIIFGNVDGPQVFRFSTIHTEGGVGECFSSCDHWLSQPVSSAFRQLPKPVTLQEFRQLYLDDETGEVFSSSTCGQESLLVPLRAMDENAGWIELRNREVGLPVSESERKYLEILGKQIGRELVRERALMKERQYSRERAVILEAGKIITSDLDLQKVMARLVKTSMKTLGISRCAICLLDEKREGLQVFYSPNEDDPAIVTLAEHRINPEVESERVVFREGRPYYSEDAQNDPNTPIELNKASNVVSILVIPIISQGEVIGAIYLDEPGVKHRFAEEDIRIMEGLATFAAIATENAQLFMQSQHKQKRVRELMLHLAKVQEEERARISRELHDSLASLLLDIIYRYEGLLGRESEEVPREELAEMLQSSRSALAELRRIISDLRPSSIEALGLSKALKAYLERHSLTYHLPIRIEIEDGLKLDDLHEHSIFRIVQEAFSNIHRHSRATRASVDLFCADGQIILDIVDNGVGFNLEEAIPSGGMGLTHIRDRAELMGGVFELESEKGKGTHLRFTIPLPSQNWKLESRKSESLISTYHEEV